MNSVDLLEDEDVRRWYENLKRSSEQTARERLRVLARLFRLMATTPTKVVEEVSDGNGKDFEDRLMDFLNEQLEAGRTASYLENYLKAVRSWLEHNGLVLRRRIKLGNTRATPTLTEEQIPTREQLRDLIMAGSPRARAVISLIAFAGLRPGVMGNFKGTDGLRLKDLPDLDLRHGVRFSQTPVMIRVRPELSKVSYPFHTFLGEEGTEHLRRYLEIRLDDGEELEPNAPVIRCAPGFETMGKREGAENRGSPFVVTGNIRGDVKQAMEKAGYDARPYVLRRYFETQLFNASWKGLVPRDWITLWAGHKGDIEHVYTLHKGIPQGLIEEMREAYRKAELYLSTVSLIPESGYEVKETEDKLAALVERLVEEKFNALNRGGPATGAGR